MCTCLYVFMCCVCMLVYMCVCLYMTSATCMRTEQENTQGHTDARPRSDNRRHERSLSACDGRGGADKPQGKRESFLLCEGWQYEVRRACAQTCGVQLGWTGTRRHVRNRGASAMKGNGTDVPDKFKRDLDDATKSGRCRDELARLARRLPQTSSTCRCSSHRPSPLVERMCEVATLTQRPVRWRAARHRYFGCSCRSS